jgi:hypothetical protein
MSTVGLGMEERVMTQTPASLKMPGMQRRSRSAAVLEADRLRALRYERVRQAMVAELCAPGVRPGVGAAQVAATLAFADIGATPGQVFELPDRVTACWVIRMLLAPRQVRLGRPGDGTSRVWVQVDDPVRVLSRFGYGGGRSWVLGGLGRDAATGAIRGAIAAAGHLTREGLRITCPSPQIAVTMMALLERVGVTVEKPRRGGVDVIIAWTGACAAMSSLRLSGAAAAYGRLLNAELAAEQAARAAAAAVKAARYKAVLLEHNTARARVAADAEPERIAALGDLDAYELPEQLRRAAEVRRDHRGLNYSQADAVLAISKDVFTGRIRRFWRAIDTFTAGQIA